jgi:hypothetical protein
VRVPNDHKRTNTDTLTGKSRQQSPTAAHALPKRHGIFGAASRPHSTHRVVEREPSQAGISVCQGEKVMLQPGLRSTPYGPGTCATCLPQGIRLAWDEEGVFRSRAQAFRASLIRHTWVWITTHDYTAQPRSYFNSPPSKSVDGQSRAPVRSNGLQRPTAPATVSDLHPHHTQPALDATSNLPGREPGSWGNPVYATMPTSRPGQSCLGGGSCYTPGLAPAVNSLAPGHI